MFILLSLHAIDLPWYHPNCNPDLPFYNQATQQCSSNCGASGTDAISIGVNLTCYTSICARALQFRISSGELISVCLECRTPTPFYDRRTMRCTSACSQVQQIVDQNSVCMDLCVQVVRDALLQIGSFTRPYQICSDCSANSTFYNGSTCVSKCSEELYFTYNYSSGQCLAQDQCQGVLSDVIITSTYDYKQCFDCPLSKPFYNGQDGTCVEQCPQTAEEATRLCTACSPERFYEPLIDPVSGRSYYACVSQCRTNQSVNGRCLTCIELSQATPVYDPATSGCAAACQNKYTLNGQQVSLVDQNRICTTTPSFYINEYRTMARDSVYMTTMQAYSYQEQNMPNYQPQNMVCANFAYNGICVTECPTKINNTNVVDINNNCLDEIGNGYLVDQQGYQTYYPQCDQYVVVENNRVYCVQQCSRYVLDRSGARYCLDGHSCPQKTSVSQTQGRLPVVTCSADCAAGYVEIVQNVCVDETRCVDYANNRCQGTTDGTGCTMRYQENGSNVCLDRCPNYADNYMCVNSCIALVPQKYVGSNGVDCVVECDRSEILQAAAPEMQCSACTNGIKDLTVCVDACPSQRPINDFGVCNTTCSNQTSPLVMNYGTNACVDQCSTYIYKGLFNDIAVDFCVDRCSMTNLTYVASPENNTCVLSCEPSQIHSQDNVCISCGGLLPYKNENTCVANCYSLNKLLEDQVCVDRCTGHSNTEVQGLETVCVRPLTNNAGAIAGGVVAAIVVIIIVAVLAVLGVKGKLSCKKQSENNDKPSKVKRSKNSLKETDVSVKEASASKIPGHTGMTSHLVESAIVPAAQVETQRVKSRLTPLPQAGSLSKTPGAQDDVHNQDTGDVMGDDISGAPQRKRKKRARRTKELGNDLQLDIDDFKAQE